ncbi:Cell division protein FtsA [Coxiella endosymbiont of Amblyomma nuttalli]|nr:Cell division protein FtsA [Coxiella endosymbiont of Amblyomma nuttalli]
MPKNPDKNLIVALDIGTSKIAALVGAVSQDNQIEVIGFGTHPSRGLKRGVVINIESTVRSIQHAIEEAELMAGCDIRSAYTGIAGGHIRSLNSHGIVAIRNCEVNQSDVDRVIDAAKAVAIPADQKILHVLPQEFIIDNQEGVREPVGMSGVRLEAKVHIITGAVSAAQNITKCVRCCGLQVGDVVLEQLASSHSVLTDDEKELGVCMVDIGGGTTDIAIFTEGAIRHTYVIPIAGDHVTNDVAVALRTPTQYAEQIKIKYASALPQKISAEETIQVPSIAKRPPKQIQKRGLAQVVAERYEELFELVLSELHHSGFKDLITAGVVLTGGASRVPGCIELAEHIFQMPVRLGLPQYVNGLVDVRENPIYATAVGLLIHWHQNQSNNRGRPVFDLEYGMSLWQRMKSWFQGTF